MSETRLERPGGKGIASRALHFIWIVDCSGSMGSDGKIQALNTAIREALPHMKETASGNPHAQVLVRALKFSNGAQWHVTTPTPVDQFSWTDLEAAGVTDLGKALEMVASELSEEKMGSRALPPVLVLVSDGQPTDDWGKGLASLLGKPWGKKAVRLAIAIGEDAAVPEAQGVLQKFIGHPEIKPLQANSPDALVRYIKWVSTAVVNNVSKPASKPMGELATPEHPAVPIPQAPQVDPNASAVW